MNGMEPDDPDLFIAQEGPEFAAMVDEAMKRKNAEADRACLATWGVVRPGPGDALYCGLSSGHAGPHEDGDGGVWDDSDRWAAPHATSPKQ